LGICEDLRQEDGKDRRVVIAIVMVNVDEGRNDGELGGVDSLAGECVLVELCRQPDLIHHLIIASSHPTWNTKDKEQPKQK